MLLVQIVISWVLFFKLYVTRIHSTFILQQLGQWHTNNTRKENVSQYNTYQKPNDCKLANVTTVFKKGSKSSTANYRQGLPDLPYFPEAPVFRLLSPVSRTEAKISRI